MVISSALNFVGRLSAIGTWSAVGGLARCELSRRSCLKTLRDAHFEVGVDTREGLRKPLRAATSSVVNESPKVVLDRMIFLRWMDLIEPFPQTRLRQ